jgi:hypothetical protein
MDKVSGVGVVKKSNRVRRVFCPIWKRPYHKNCNCLADENEIDDIGMDTKINSIFNRVKFHIVNFFSYRI